MPGLLPCRWILYHLSYPGSPLHHWDCSNSFKCLVKAMRIGKRENWMWTIKTGEWGGWLIRGNALSYNLRRYGAKSRPGNLLKPASPLEARSMTVIGIIADNGNNVLLGVGWCRWKEVKGWSQVQVSSWIKPCHELTLGDSVSRNLDIRDNVILGVCSTLEKTFMNLKVILGLILYIR